LPSISDRGIAGHYLRFKLDKTPISTRVPLGTENGIFWNTGDEHTEEGHITEDPFIRTKMMDKRLSKLDLALHEIPDEDKAVQYGRSDQSVGLTAISWGSTKGAIMDAVDRLALEGKQMQFVQVRLMHPFPKDLLERLLSGTRILVDIEMNHTSQLGSLITEYLRRPVDYKIVKYNGRPISSSEIYNALVLIIHGNAPRRIVLEHGT
jgi:2-oxoglutarate ferredoxin oxidoreductase subunit alpha